tara:strand:- start:311 stop:586 length:276 start_codon:yes stop_codon:yes gene_type:complete
METPKESLKDVLEDFIDKLPDKMTNEEFSWIIFNLLGVYGKIIKDWEIIDEMVIGRIAHYFLNNEVEMMNNLAKEKTKIFLEKIMKEHKSK